MSKRSWVGLSLAFLSVALFGCPIDDAKIVDDDAGAGLSGASSSSSAGGMTASSSSTGGSGGSSSSGSGGSGGSGGGGGGSGGSGGGSGGSGGMGGGCPAPGLPGSCGVAGCPACGTLLLVATGDPQGMFARLTPPAAWMTTTFNGQKSTDAPALAGLASKPDGIVVIRRSDTNPPGQLSYAPIGTSGLGTFAAFDTSVPWSGVPSIAASATALHLVTKNAMNLRFYYSEFQGGAFTVMPEEIVVASTYSLGDAMAGIAVLGSTPLIVNEGFSGVGMEYYHQSRVAGVWQAAVKETVAFEVANATPAVVALSSTSALVVLSGNSGNQLFWVRVTNNVWSAPQALPSMASTEPVLTTTPNGDAILAYRDATGNVSWARFLAASSSWTAATALGAKAKSNVALAPGAGDAEAEIAYVDTGGKVQHARLQGGTFTAPVQVGSTSANGVAIATKP